MSGLQPAQHSQDRPKPWCRPIDPNMTLHEMHGNHLVDEVSLIDVDLVPHTRFCSECIVFLHHGCLPPEHCEQDKYPLELDDRFIGPVDIDNGVIQRHARELRDLLRTLQPARAGDDRDDRESALSRAFVGHDRQDEDLAVVIRKRLDVALVKALLRAGGGALQAYPADARGVRVVSIGDIDIRLRQRNPPARPRAAT
ncbi:hypothetical protein BBO_09476 [Beauveria brongniartii RCEF 3172]|uniref:Uncharacterized protein n=1 Tax=Beauveria brongniartii RCEF 3172 TaxID=1081107 RepID=A0A168FDE7_9HYPO|nr:hypothetical protein BBO_09476 [Beauveria brongniartii RCEF 3172]